MTPEIGDVLADHHLLERIGENGGSGCLLYRAQDVRLNRTVAFKLLPAHFTENEGFRRRFEREAEMAARINEHRNVVSVYQFGEVAGQLFLTMQYIDGRDLAQVIRTEGPLDISRTCVILEQVAEALDTAHATGLVHRDVKPGNIFVSTRGPLVGPVTAYIGDFGLALPLGDPGKTTSLYYGTPGYVAPERRAGAPPTRLVDVYGLGCVAYACLTGAPPFDPDSDEVSPAPPLIPHLPAGVSEVLAKAVAWQPESRYATCGEFVAALRRAGGVLHHEATKPPPLEVPTPPPALPPRRRIRPQIVAAVASVIVIATAVIVGVSTMAVPGQPSSSSVPTPVQWPVGAALSALALDSRGNLYVADRGDHRVRRLTPTGQLSTVAGGNGAGFTGDGGKAAEAKLEQPEGLAADADGNLYIADAANDRIRKVDRDGVISTVASGLDWPASVAVDPRGGLFVAEADGHRVVRVDEAGNVTVVAGTGAEGFSGDGEPASEAQLSSPVSLAVHAGNLYIGDSGNVRVRRVDRDGTITTVAGNGEEPDDDEEVGDGNAATDVVLRATEAITVDSNGVLYVADQIDQRIRRVDADGVITTVAGNGSAGFLGDGGKASAAMVAFPEAVAAGRDGSLYVADTRNQRIRHISGAGVITTIAGAGRKYPADGGPATRAFLWNPETAQTGPDGSIYISDEDNHRIRKVDRNGVITTVAGTGVAGDTGDGGPATEARIDEPTGVTVDQAGNVYIADFGVDRVRKVTPDGRISTVAGVGRFGHSKDGGQADESEMASPNDLATDQHGNLFITEYDGHRVRKVDPDGVLTTVAGSGTKGFSGDGGPATQAKLSEPTSVDVMADGTLYIADSANLRVRRIDPNGVITTVAGTGNQSDAGDGGPASAASIGEPVTVTVDEAGNVYIADGFARRVRRIGTDGVITSVLGTGREGMPVDGAAAAESDVTHPTGVHVDGSGLYVVDEHNGQVYLITDGIVRVVAGAGW